MTDTRFRDGKEQIMNKSWIYLLGRQPVAGPVVRPASTGAGQRQVQRKVATSKP